MTEQFFIPKHRQLTDFYKSKIIKKEYLPGQRLDSINHMMIKHGISMEMAQMVLQRLMDEGLIVSSNGKGPIVASKKVAHNIWGLIIPFYSQNMEQLIQSLENETKHRGRQLSHFIAFNNPEEEIRIIKRMIDEEYEAILVVPNYDESLTADFYRNLQKGRDKIVLLDNTMTGLELNFVIQGYDLGVKRALDYLIAHTEGNLLMLKNQAWKNRDMLSDLTEQFFKHHTGVNYPEREVFVLSEEDLTLPFIKNNNIKGVLTFADIDAIKVVGMTKDYGMRIPGDIRLVNYGNTPLTDFYSPAITVIDCMYKEMAEKIAELIDGGSSTGQLEQHIIQPQLIVRST